MSFYIPKRTFRLFKHEISSFFLFGGLGDKYGLPRSGPDQDFQSGSGFADPFETGPEAVVETLVVGSTSSILVRDNQKKSVRRPLYIRSRYQ